MSCRISEGSVFKRTTNQVCCDTGGESVILNLKSGTYYSVHEVGAKIWALIEQPTAIGAIRDAIVNEYDVDPEVCARDLRAFINGLETAGLIEVLDTVNNVAVV